MSQRYRLVIEYDGAGFCGWQSQNEQCGVQDALRVAIEKFCGEEVVVYGAGRTDSGVHARGQVAHIDLAHPRDADTLQRAVNFHLKPQPVVILAATPVRDDFDARFSALKRHYLYRIIDRPTPLTIEAGRAWWVPVRLDEAAMQGAASLLCGQHDFTTFRATHCQAKSPVKTIDEIKITRRDGKEQGVIGGQDEMGAIEIYVTARSFLQHQIRSFAGALKYIGEGKWHDDELKSALEARDRTACPPIAPPEGLYFMRVDY